MNAYSILQHAHSGLRWLVLIFLVLAIARALMNWSNQTAYEQRDRTALLALIFTHVQLILGLILYFISPYVRFEGEVMGDSVTRFYTVEHISMMLVAIAAITIGYSRAKRQLGTRNGWRSLWVFYGIGLLLILAAIPWPFRGLGGQWF